MNVEPIIIFPIPVGSEELLEFELSDDAELSELSLDSDEVELEELYNSASMIPTVFWILIANWASKWLS